MNSSLNLDPMPAPMLPPTVNLLDADPQVRTSIRTLIEHDGLAAVGYEHPNDLLRTIDPDEAGCIVLEIDFEGMSGLDLQAELHRRGILTPVIFLVARGTISQGVQAVKAGAYDYLTKPVDESTLLDRIKGALLEANETRNRNSAQRVAHARLAELTDREQAVLALAISGYPNKEIARKLAISHRTVEAHRAHILLKSGATSFLELSRLVTACCLDEHARLLWSSTLRLDPKSVGPQTTARIDVSLDPNGLYRRDRQRFGQRPRDNRLATAPR